MKVTNYLVFDHLLSNMLRQYDKSHRQAFLNTILKMLKIIEENSNYIGTEINLK